MAQTPVHYFVDFFYFTVHSCSAMVHGIRLDLLN